MMKASRRAWPGGSRPTEPSAASTATESQPEVWLRRDGSSLSGSEVNGSQSGNLIKLSQWPIETHRPQPPPSTPRRASLESDRSSAAARVIPLTRWPLSDPRGGRRAIFDAAAEAPRRTTPDNRYVSDPCRGRKSSEFTKQHHNRESTEDRALKTKLFFPDDKYWSEEDSICVLSDGGDEYLKTTTCLPTECLMAPSKDIDMFGDNKHQPQDTALCKVNPKPQGVTDLTEGHQGSMKCTNLLDETFPLRDKDCTSVEEHNMCLQGKRGGEKCARLMSRLCRRKRSKQQDNAV